MNKKKCNIGSREPYQLELPFDKSRQNYINDIPRISHPSEWQPWFNQLIPHLEWDCRSLKKYRAEFYYSDCDYLSVNVYATSYKLARNYLEKYVSLISLSNQIPDFTNENTNKAIVEAYRFKDIVLEIGRE